MNAGPSYRFHKGSGQAVVTIQGRTYYLGKFDSAESKQKYHRLLAESKVSSTFGIEKKRVSVSEAVVAYLKHSEVYYRGGSEHVALVSACGPLIECYPDLHLSEFGIPQFKVIRQRWIERGASRQYTNAQMKRLLRVAKWWVSEGLADATLHHSLRCVEPLKFGRCTAPETEPVKPVSDEDVRQTVEHLPRVVADMVRFQAIVGCRPGEVCGIKPRMVRKLGDVWQVELEEHKNRWRKHSRVITCGPKAQAILTPYLDSRSPDSYCFSPDEANAQRRAEKHAKRKTPLSCGNRPGSNQTSSPKRKAGACYTANSYCKAIHYACKKAGVALWGPNRLRHSAATKLRELEGIESASLLLGHKSLTITEVYAEKSRKQAERIAIAYG